MLGVEDLGLIGLRVVDLGFKGLALRVEDLGFRA